MIGLGGSESIESFESFNSFFSGRSFGSVEFDGVIVFVEDKQITKSSSYSSEKPSDSLILESCCEWFEDDVTEFLLISETGFEAGTVALIVRGFWKQLELNLRLEFPDLGLIFVDISFAANVSLFKSPKISFNIFDLLEATLF